MLYQNVDITTCLLYIYIVPKISIAASPMLSNRHQFPRSFRLLPPESMFNIAKLAMFQEFKWRKVATLHESVPLFSLVSEYHINWKTMFSSCYAPVTFPPIVGKAHARRAFCLKSHGNRGNLTVTGGSIGAISAD